MTGHAVPRVLVVDDEEAILNAYRESLSERPRATDELSALEASLFGADPDRRRISEGAFRPLDLTLKKQGQAAVDCVSQAAQAGRPFAVAFVDIRMPPGIDGIETAKAIWRIDPAMFIVLVTAYSDIDVGQAASEMANSEKLLYLAKPFQPDEIRRHAAALSRIWQSERELLSALDAREAELIRARDKAEAGKRAKDAVLANVTHHLRTPLNAILGFSGVIAEGGEIAGDPVRTAEYAAEIARAGRQLLGAIGELLDLANLEAGEVELSLEAVDLRGALDWVRAGLAPFAAEREVLLDVQAPSAAAIRGDAEHVEGILTRLIHNAIRFSPKGAAVAIRIEETSEEAIVAIVNGGATIDESKLDLVQQPFRQASEGYARSHDGLGLGLTIAKRLVEMQGGALSIESLPQGGTSVRIAFRKA